eukprot:SAG11_NODE_9503_length_906_cov_1.033457_2_plen_79_part_00
MSSSMLLCLALAFIGTATASYRSDKERTLVTVNGVNIDDFAKATGGFIGTPFGMERPSRPDTPTLPLRDPMRMLRRPW